MADNSMPSTLSTATDILMPSQPINLDEQHTAPHPAPPPIQVQVQGVQDDVSDPQGTPSIATIANPESPETPSKKRPGRPKGSGKRALDLELKIKRPVGRPRKDGLPAGSVGPKRPPRPRKRPPGDYASSSTAPTPGVYSYTFSDPNQWSSISAPPMTVNGRAPPNSSFPIDPALDRDNWADLSRQRPDLFLHTLVNALSAPNPISIGGITVEEAFRSHLASLASSTNGTASPGIPTLYSVLKTFWLPASPVYFSLTASSSARTPSDHRFLYWDPQPLVFNGIACPFCTSSLINKGRITTGPIKVYDLGRPFYVIGCEYICKSPVCLSSTNGEGRKFASTDASVFRALPPKLRDEFPARLLTGSAPATDLGSGQDVWSWRGMGVSTELWNMVKASLQSNIPKETILGIIRSVASAVPDGSWVNPITISMSISAHVGVKKFEVGEDSISHQDENTVEVEEGEEGEEEEAEGELPVANKETSVEEFHEAWQASNGSEEASQGVNGTQDRSQPQAGPSDPSHPANMSQIVPATPGAPEYYTVQTMPPYGYHSYGYYLPHTPVPVTNGAVLKRTFALVDNSGEGGMSEPMHKRVRHCVKCGSNECKGKGGRAFCTNPCQDCGKLDCKGRNSKRPDKTCADAW